MRLLSEKIISLIVILSLASVGGVFAEDIVIDQDSSWAAGTYTCDDVHISEGATLAFDGEATPNAENVASDSSSSISTDGKDYGHGTGPGDDGIGALCGPCGAYGGVRESWSWQAEKAGQGAEVASPWR